MVFEEFKLFQGAISAENLKLKMISVTLLNDVWIFSFMAFNFKGYFYRFFRKNWPESNLSLKFPMVFLSSI